MEFEEFIRILVRVLNAYRPNSQELPLLRLLRLQGERDQGTEEAVYEVGQRIRPLVSQARLAYRRHDQERVDDLRRQFVALGAMNTRHFDLYVCGDKQCNNLQDAVVQLISGYCGRSPSTIDKYLRVGKRSRRQDHPAKAQDPPTVRIDLLTRFLENFLVNTSDVS